MRIEYIHNQLHNFDTLIDESFNKATEVKIASAFIDEYAISKIEQILKKNKGIKDITILTGLYHFFNKKTNLEKLLALTKKHPSVLKVNVSREPNFHLKYYYFKLSSSETCYIGSANFTKAGLENNPEMLAKITNNNSDKTSEKFAFNSIREFNKELRNSIGLHELKLENYKEHKDTSKTKINKRKFDSLFPSIENVTEIESQSKNAIAIVLKGALSKKTMEIVTKQCPDWNEYFLFSLKSEFVTCPINQRMIIIHIDRAKSGKPTKYTYFWAKVTNHATIKTVDGNYFVAYKSLSKQKNLKSSEIEHFEKNIFRMKLGSNKIKPKVLRSRMIERLEKLLC